MVIFSLQFIMFFKIEFSTYCEKNDFFIHFHKFQRVSPLTYVWFFLGLYILYFNLSKHFKHKNLHTFNQFFLLLLLIIWGYSSYKIFYILLFWYLGVVAWVPIKILLLSLEVFTNGCLTSLCLSQDCFRIYEIYSILVEFHDFRFGS